MRIQSLFFAGDRRAIRIFGITYFSRGREGGSVVANRVQKGSHRKFTAMSGDHSTTEP